MERRRFLFGLAATATMPAAWSQNRPIRLLVPFAPGGATDVIAREIAMLMGKHLGATVVVENRGGAGGSIGTSEVARAAPDGYTLGLATQSTHAVNPVVYRKVGYDPLADFTLLGEIAQAPGILLVNAKVPAATLAQFVQHLRSHPDQLTYSSPGNGTIGHVWGELFKHSTGTTMLHVPYKGASQALADLVAGQVDSTFTSVASAMPYLRNGRVRALAVSWPRRLDMLPEVPTYAEAGWPDNNQPTWYGLVGPAGLSADARGALRAAMRAALDDPGLREKYRGQGVFPALGTPEQFAATIRRDMDSVAAIRRTAHISVD
ncbi:Bug family tripartite tricarboxylate transporter substrate binding protein [Pigmentiphaga kullae]|uniref:Tripartite-type tricarboxylate transporter receptor subunit TctC n=1 Tax=Pigmentiphaga kullae TaxID=151784 RepID=A0A4Q7NGP6_9BURK|nr:tripartite tricarboxylate transporter substrate binding protein [Pigmentiphaga kullae]RZS84009.1 tripartite-type tricarboxylate transporter receptor subunit TctC [Pigmentiphaga kullae]